MTPSQRDRYSRQLLFAPLGAAGQERLLSSRVAIVGHLRLIDRDYVEASNRERQWLYDEAEAAVRRTVHYLAANPWLLEPRA